MASRPKPATDETKSDAVGTAAASLVAEFNEAVKDPDVAMPIAAISLLSKVIGRSNATTMTELRKVLRDSVEQLKKQGHALGHGISVAAGCEIFLCYVTRSFLDFDDIGTCLRSLRERGEQFAALSRKSRDKIMQFGLSFIRDNMVLLLHGHSRVVVNLLLHAAKTKHFRVIVLEGGPQKEGVKVAKKLLAAGIPVTMTLDSAVGYIMEQVDLVLVGAEAVVENGGIINKVGTNTVGVVAKAYKKPLYACVESYKFSRIFPLSQKDLPLAKLAVPRLRSWTLAHGDEPVELPGGLEVDNPSVDYTPPQYISYLLTDLGVFTPSAVSDELIKLYQ